MLENIFWVILFSVLALIKLYQNTFRCSSIFSAISHRLCTSYENGNCNEKQECYFSCQKFFSAAGFWKYLKNGLILQKQAKLIHCLHTTSLFDNFILHVSGIILHSITFLILFVRKSGAKLIVSSETRQEIFRIFYSKLIL